MTSEVKRVGEELVERLARFVESLPNDAASSAQPSLGPTDGPAHKPSVPRTAVRQIAKECARAICHGGVVMVWQKPKGDWPTCISELTQKQVAERLEHTLNAINARK
jgi:hypothetical protein